MSTKLCGGAGVGGQLKTNRKTQRGTLGHGSQKLDVPTLIRHGDADQIASIAELALLSSQIAKGATFKSNSRRVTPHVLDAKDQINTELLAFIKGAVTKAKARVTVYSTNQPGRTPI
jgi:hypothetical protein